MISEDDPDARICVDFGTATSKASLCAPQRTGAAPAQLVHPLPLGQIAGEDNPFLVHSALMFDGGRILFGGAALTRARDPDAATDPLQSFKTFLAARDPEATLRSRLRRNIDPSGRFSQRDALVLYTAYLTRLTERAVLAQRHLHPRLLTRPRRFAFPRWRPNSAANAFLVGVFDDAAAAAAQFGDALCDPGGIEAAAARHVLDNARLRPGDGRIEGGVFEAQAAAECHLAYGGDAPRHMLVFDMGAGTTDITAVERTRGGGGREGWREIGGERATLSLACDEVDRLMLAVFIDRAGSERRRGAHDKFWRRLALNARGLKERLFRDGVCEAHYEGRRIVVRTQDLMKDRTFRAFRHSLADAYQVSLSRVAKRAADDGADTVGVILAGGGAMLPFVQQMASHARPSVSRIRRVDVRPLVPAWAHHDSFGADLAPIFPQIAISIGGAVAAMPAPMQAAH